ncbi:MAG: hypothetical protein SV765_00275 [Pseudomonadota bacterium]|nr:hypothetical protein [Pseudomonadota bacterium]
MDSSSYKAQFKARFSVWWRRLIPFMALIFLLDMGSRAMTGAAMTAANINAYIAIPIATLLLAVILAIISPAFRPIIFIFKKIASNEIALLFTVITGAGIAIYFLGWWSLAILFVIMWLTSDSSDSSRSSSDSSAGSSRGGPTYQNKLDAASNLAREKSDAERRWREQNKN